MVECSLSIIFPVQFLMVWTSQRDSRKACPFLCYKKYCNKNGVGKLFKEPLGSKISLYSKMHLPYFINTICRAFISGKSLYRGKGDGTAMHNFRRGLQSYSLPDPKINQYYLIGFDASSLQDKNATGLR
jgi:hypothetical protein